MTNDKNPFEAPAESTDSTTSEQKIEGLLLLAFWFIAAFAYWRTQVVIRPIYADFEISLPPITAFLVSQPIPISIIVLAVASTVAMHFIKKRAIRHAIQFLSAILLFSMIFVCVYAFFSPFSTLIINLSG